MNRVFTISEPMPFYCEKDEDYFFQWLQSIPAVTSVTGSARGLQLTLEDPIDKQSLYELAGIMTRYSIARKCLRTLCNASNEAWFKDSSMYWYKDVFED